MLERLFVHNIHEHISLNSTERDGHQVIPPTRKPLVVTGKALEKQISTDRPVPAPFWTSLAPQQPQSAQSGKLSKLRGIVPSGTMVLTFRGGRRPLDDHDRTKNH